MFLRILKDTTKYLTFNKNHIILFLLFIASPFFDNITGFLVLSKIVGESFLGSPSQIVRALIFLLVLNYLKNWDLLKVIFILVFFVSLEIIATLFHHSLVGLLKGIVFDYKVCYLISLVFFLGDLLRKDDRNFEVIYLYVFYTGIVYSLMLIVPRFLGIGFSTYNEGTFGFKGFFPSQNGLGVFLGVLINLNIYCFRLKENRPKFFYYFLFLMIISLLLLGTKTAFVFSLVSLIYLYFLLPYNYKIVIGTPVFLGAIWLVYDILPLLATVFDVVVWRYNNSDSLFDFILSGRNVYIYDAFSLVDFDQYPWRVIFGFGTFVSFQNPQILSPVAYDTLETDLFDIFFSYGLVGIIGYLSLIFSGFYYSVKKKSKSLFFIWGLLMLHSIFAGHVIFASFSALAVAVLYVIIVFNENTFSSSRV